MKANPIPHPVNTIADNSLVRVHGFAMLSKIEDGKTYLIKRDDARRLYWFCVPRTGRKVVGHYQDGIDHGLQCFPRGDGNCLEVFAQMSA